MYTFPNVSPNINFVDPQNSHVDWTRPGRGTILIIILTITYLMISHFSLLFRSRTSQQLRML